MLVLHELVLVWVVSVIERGSHCIKLIYPSSLQYWGWMECRDG